MNGVNMLKLLSYSSIATTMIYSHLTGGSHKDGGGEAEVLMLPFKKKVRCTECGYLIDNSAFLSCYRESLVSDPVAFIDKMAGTAKLFRRCKSYHKKIPGLTPEQHLEHYLYKGPGVNLSRWALFWSIIAVIISAIAMIISVWAPLK